MKRYFIIFLLLLPLFSFGQDVDYGNIDSLLPKPEIIKLRKIKQIIIQDADSNFVDTVFYDLSNGKIKSGKFYWVNGYKNSIPYDSLPFTNKRLIIASYRLSVEEKYYYSKDVLDSIVTINYTKKQQENGLWINMPETSETLQYDSLGRLVANFSHCLKMSYYCKDSILFRIITAPCITKPEYTMEGKLIFPGKSDTVCYYYDDKNRLIKVKKARTNYFNEKYTFTKNKITKILYPNTDMEELTFYEYKRGKLIKENWSTKDSKYIGSYYYKKGLLKKFVLINSPDSLREKQTMNTTIVNIISD